MSEGWFQTTHWTLVRAAGSADTQVARDALESLCQTYWYPLYAYVRSRGNSPHDAQDLTQGFFCKLLEKDYLSDANPARGHLRSFLLSSLKHYMANEWDKAQAQKRGGDQVFVSVDQEFGETRFREEPVERVTPEHLYERRWALTVLDGALEQLRANYAAMGRTALFESLKFMLTLGKGSVPYAEIATQLEMTESAVKVAAHRLRQRYRDSIRQVIAHTVSSPDEIDAELRQLMTAFSRRD
jgi:RNA polymerase sigma factor (sigma-70 family)